MTMPNAGSRTGTVIPVDSSQVRSLVQLLRDGNTAARQFTASLKALRTGGSTDPHAVAQLNNGQLPKMATRAAAPANGGGGSAPSSMSTAFGVAAVGVGAMSAYRDAHTGSYLQREQVTLNATLGRSSTYDSRQAASAGYTSQLANTGYGDVTAGIAGLQAQGANRNTAYERRLISGGNFLNSLDPTLGASGAQAAQARMSTPSAFYTGQATNVRTGPGVSAESTYADAARELSDRHDGNFSDAQLGQAVQPGTMFNASLTNLGIDPATFVRYIRSKKDPNAIKGTVTQAAANKGAAQGRLQTVMDAGFGRGLKTALGIETGALNAAASGADNGAVQALTQLGTTLTSLTGTLRLLTGVLALRGGGAGVGVPGVGGSGGLRNLAKGGLFAADAALATKAAFDSKNLYDQVSQTARDNHMSKLDVIGKAVNNAPWYQRLFLSGGLTDAASLYSSVKGGSIATGDSGSNGPSMGRGPSTVSAIEALGASTGAVVTSTVREGGNSYHATGNAVDFAAAGGGSDTDALLKINQFWAKYAPGLAELIYTGPGGVSVKDGKIVPSSFWGADVAAQHHNHVHVAATEETLKKIGAAAGGGSVGTPGKGSGVSGTPAAKVGNAASTLGLAGVGALFKAAVSSAVAAAVTPLSGVVSAATSSTSAANSSTASSSAGGVDAWITSALGILGANTPSNVADLRLIIQGESGGDPNSVNNVDSNARAGTPSKGLMQLIQPTFDAHARAGHKNILDPVDNILAGYDYAVSRYGSLDNVPGVKAVHAGQNYVGYRRGNWEVLADEFAMLHKGEMVVKADTASQLRDTVQQSGGGGAGGSGGGTSVHMPVTVQLTTLGAGRAEMVAGARMLGDALEEVMREKRLVSGGGA